MPSERLQVILELITGQYKREAREAATATGQIGKSAQAATGPLGAMNQVWKNFAGPAAIIGAGVAVASFAKDSIMAASDLEESINAVDVVFGEAADAIHEFGKTSVDSVGLAAVNVNKSATVLGSALINVGLDADTAAAKTIELTTRAADMASVFNTTVPEALGAIQSALRGETDPIEKFGVSLNAAAVDAEAAALGYKKVAGEFDTTAKAAARMSLIMKQTDRVAGDFQNTGDSTANTLKKMNERFTEMKGRVGQALMPAFKALLDVAEDMAPAFEDFAIQVAELIGELRPLLQLLGEIPRQAEKLKDVDSGGINVLTALFGGLSDELDIQLLKWDETINRVRLFGDEGLITVAKARPFADLAAEMADALKDDLNPELTDARDRAEFMADAVKDDLNPALVTLREKAIAVQRGLLEAKLAAQEAGRAFREDLAADYAAAAISIDKSTGDIGVSLGELETILLDNLADEAAFYTNLNTLAEEGYTDLADFLRGEGSDKVAGATADLVDDMERAASLEDMIDQGELDARAYTDRLAAAMEADRARLVDVARGIGIDLGEGFKEGLSTVDLTNLLGIALGAPGLGPVQGVTTSTGATGGSGAAGYGSGTRAFGGPISAGQMYLVGERGPEMFVSGTSGSIIPNNALSRTVNISVASPMNDFRSDLQYASVVASLVNYVEGM